MFAARVLLTILALALLYVGGMLFWIFLFELLAGSGRNALIDGLAVLCAQLPVAVGLWALSAALRLAPPGSSPTPLDERRLILAGLLFPGAAQVYAGRWTRGMFFLASPLGAYFAGLATVALAALAAPSLKIESFWGCWFAVSILLWAGSLVEAHLWAARQPADLDTVAWPRWRGVVKTVGGLLFFQILIFQLASIAVGSVALPLVKLRESLRTRAGEMRESAAPPAAPAPQRGIE